MFSHGVVLYPDFFILSQKAKQVGLAVAVLSAGRQKIVLEPVYSSLVKWLICGNGKMQTEIHFSSLYELIYVSHLVPSAFQISSAFLRTSLCFSS